MPGARSMPSSRPSTIPASKAEFDYLFVGDFNDVLKARQATEGLIAKGVDVIISALNMGNFGMFPAVMQSKRPVYVATTYTDKKSLAPGLYLTSDLFDFKIPLDHMVGKIIKDGTKTGVVPLEYGPEKAIWTQFPIQNVSDAINAKVKKAGGRHRGRKDQGDQKARQDRIRLARCG